MDENPYQSPVSEGTRVIRTRNWRRPWLILVAFGWVGFLILSVEAISGSPHSNPAQSFLTFKIVTTVFSTIACLVLVLAPRGWWKAATVPFVCLVVYIQVTGWMWLP